MTATPASLQEIQARVADERNHLFVRHERTIPVHFSDGVTWWISRDQYERLKGRKARLALISALQSKATSHE